MFASLLKLFVERASARMTAERTRALKNMILACLILALLGLASALVIEGYPPDADAAGLTPLTYWLIVGLSFGLALLLLLIRIRWRSRNARHSPIFR